jgi:hypothetical protein
VCAAERDRLYRLGAEGLAALLLQRGGWHGEGGAPGQPWAKDMLVSGEGETQTASPG